MLKIPAQIFRDRKNYPKTLVCSGVSGGSLNESFKPQSESCVSNLTNFELHLPQIGCTIFAIEISFLSRYFGIIFSLKAKHMP